MSYWMPFSAVWRSQLVAALWDNSRPRYCHGHFPPGACFSKVPGTFRVRKASGQTSICLFWKADLLTCFLCKKNQEDCEVWWLRTSDLQRYKGNCGTRNRSQSEKFGPLGLTMRKLPTNLWITISQVHEQFFSCSTLCFLPLESVYPYAQPFLSVACSVIPENIFCPDCRQ